MKIFWFVGEICLLLSVTCSSENHVQQLKEGNEECRKFTINVDDIQDPTKLSEISEFLRENFEKYGENGVEISTTLTTEGYSAPASESSIPTTFPETNNEFEFPPLDDTSSMRRHASSRSAASSKTNDVTSNVLSSPVSKSSIPVTSSETTDIQKVPVFDNATSSTPSRAFSTPELWTTRNMENMTGTESFNVATGNFLAVIHVSWRFMTFAQAGKACKDMNASVAVIPNEEVYNEILEISRKKIPFFWGWFRIWIGVTIDPSTKAITPKDAFTKWADSQPSADEDHTNTYIRVPRSSRYDGMVNGDPAWSFYGVACQVHQT